MHIPACNAELRPAILRKFISDNPLGILTTAIRCPPHPFLLSSHIPWIVDFDNTSDNKFGQLRGHIARQNPQAKAIIESLTRSSRMPGSFPITKPNIDHDGILSEDVLVLFNSLHHYVTPKFYVKSKPATGKVVPTWNYEAVEVYGRAKIYHDTRSGAFVQFLATQLSDLAHHAETSIMGYAAEKSADDPAWQVADAPSRYIDLLTKNIIGIEIEITSMAGRFKMSQEKPIEDRAGVIDGFGRLDSPLAADLAATVRERALQYDAAREESRQAATSNV